MCIYVCASIFLLGFVHTYMITVFTYVHIPMHIIIWVSEKCMTDMQPSISEEGAKRQV